tara:strand:+ start:11753 stop:13039 length:1287 start_codon:yes stop_codon:yes gene_type:complete
MKDEKTPIQVIGTDDSNLKNLSLPLKKIILSADNIAAPQRIIDIIPHWFNENDCSSRKINLFCTKNTNELFNWLSNTNGSKVLIASGDPLWFGIGRYLINKFSPEEIIFHPSPTSLQIAFSRLGRDWNDAKYISIHGRKPSLLIQELKKLPSSLFILTDPNNGSPELVLNILKGLDLESNYSFWICERLGNEKERIFQIDPSKGITQKIHPLHVVILLKKEDIDINKKDLPLFGINNSLYYHYKDRPGLITKREIRIQILADLELPNSGIIWDLGAGVGSIGLEALRLRPDIKLLSIEKRLGGADLIKKNAELLSVKPSLILENDMKQIIMGKIIPKKLSCPDRIVISGGGKNQLDILEFSLNKLKHNGIIIIPIVRLESIAEITKMINNNNYIIKIRQHQSWEGISISNSTRLVPQNPIFIAKITKS